MKQVQTTFYHFPDSFREKELKQIRTIINNGESLQLVGLPGVGTTLILEALNKVETINKKYFSKKDHVKFLLVDAEKLLEKKSNAFLKLILLSLDPISDLDANEVSLLANIENKIQKVCSNHKIVLILDHLTEVDFPELKPLYNSLYKIYRTVFPNFSFIFVNDKELTNKEELENFGDLSRLLLQNTISVSTFNKKDGMWFIKENSTKNNLKLNINQMDLIYQSTKGYPRTIKRIIEATVRGSNLENIIDNPTTDPALNLHLLELLRYKDNIENIPILNNFLRNKKGISEKFSGIKFNEKLTRNESKVFKILIEKEGKVVSREEGIMAVWGNYAVKISEHAYDQLILRLRNKLENSTPKVEIKTARGRGHIILTT